jgi:hypothetical protein
MKDDPDEVAMTGPRPKPSILTIAGIFLATLILGVLLLTPRSGILSETHAISRSSSPNSEH